MRDVNGSKESNTIHEKHFLDSLRASVSTKGKFKRDSCENTKAFVVELSAGDTGIDPPSYETHIYQDTGNTSSVQNLRQCNSPATVEGVVAWLQKTKIGKKQRNTRKNVEYGNVIRPGIQECTSLVVLKKLR